MQSGFDVELLPLGEPSSASAGILLYAAVSLLIVAAFWAALSVAQHQPRRLIGAGAAAVVGIALWASVIATTDDPLDPAEAVEAWAAERGGVVSEDGTTVELPDGCVVTARLPADDANSILLRSDEGCLDA